MGVDMSVDMCVDMCVDIGVGMCVDIEAWTKRIVCRHAHEHVRRHA